MDEPSTANDISTKLSATEGAIDLAIQEATKLLNEMIGASRQLQSEGGPLSQEPLKIAGALEALIAARGAVGLAHDQLAQADLLTPSASHEATTVTPPSTLRLDTQNPERVSTVINMSDFTNR